MFIKVSIEGTYLNTVKAKYDKPTASIHNGEVLKTSPVRSGTRQIGPLLPFLFIVVLEVLPKAIRRKKKSKQARKGI